jgi:C4-dicarboxylate transporter
MAEDTTPSGDEWVAAFARQLGVDAPDPRVVEALLDLAGVAAHASERTAAPIACYLVGRAGVAPEDALAIARATAP